MKLKNIKMIDVYKLQFYNGKIVAFFYMDGVKTEIFNDLSDKSFLSEDQLKEFKRLDEEDDDKPF